jgi:hypothetical protein
MSINRHARAAISELERGGVTGLTPEEVVALHELGTAYDAAAHSEFMPGTGVPVRIGGAVLWPVTMAGQDWWDRIGPQIAGEKRERRIMAFGYCLAHGRQAGAFDHVGASDAMRDARRWARGLTCTIDELDEACAEVYVTGSDTSAEALTVAADTVAQGLHLAGQEALADQVQAAVASISRDPSAPPDVPGTPKGYTGRWRALCCRVAAICGGTPDDWAYLPMRDALRTYEAAIEMETAKIGGGRKGPPQAVSDALLAMRKEVVAIARRRSKS